ncbi:hypothetical protein [Frankia gtarii]|uniref:hypothetical protein n=1 Tax=Frankia gtarii TaxID=2950102 RepID=UPI0021BF492D|nr:hypothetical protein [Frankia gtarii]
MHDVRGRDGSRQLTGQRALAGGAWAVDPDEDPRTSRSGTCDALGQNSNIHGVGCGHVGSTPGSHRDGDIQRSRGLNVNPFTGVYSAALCCEGAVAKPG